MGSPNVALCLPDLVTPLSTADLITAAADGYSLFMGEDPLAHALAVLVAQICLETGNGQKMHRFNVGNVKWSADWEGFWTMFGCNEIIAGKPQWFNPPHPQTWFRAWNNAADGMAAQVEFLSTRDRYRQAWHWLLQGDAEKFVRALADAGYFTANVDAYTRAVVSIYSSVLPACERAVGGQPPIITPATADRVTGLVLSSLYDLAHRDLRLGEDLAA